MKFSMVLLVVLAVLGPEPTINQFTTTGPFLHIIPGGHTVHKFHNLPIF